MTGTINRESIVAAARGIVEKDGFGALTMRGLATKMGTKPMTLYYYVPNKEALMAALLEQAAAEIPWSTATGAPRDRMIAVIVEMADRLSENDWVIPALRARTQVGAPALTLLNQFVESAYELGATDQQAIDAWRACWYLVSSELMWRSEARSQSEATTAWYESIDPARLAEFPAVRELLPRMPEIADDFDLRAAIRHQVDGAIADFGV